ncbi:MAG: hypothetical protein ACFFCX_12600 [Candidatus Sifarchaeia archaeon]
MKRTRIVIIPFLCIILFWMPTTIPTSETRSSLCIFQNTLATSELMSLSQSLDAQTGTLNPILIEHFGQATGLQPYSVGRTDIDHTPNSEVIYPAGSQDNYYSADCSGGYFLVGVGGTADFGSSQGTISLWIKWDTPAPNGRFWGQYRDFETRWENDRLRLDWGSDNTLLGIKNSWIQSHWYFISIVWDQSTNYLAIFWGDEENEPVEDISSSSWTGSLAGLITANTIMSSRNEPSYSVDGHVDDFRYYNLARSLEDIRSDYNKSLTGTEYGLVHFYEFEDDLSDSAGSTNLVTQGSYSFSVDVIPGDGGWRAEQIEVDIRELSILHVLNGTFESGNPGTNVDWSGDGTYYADGWLARREVLNFNGRQRASYIDTANKYIIIENEGYEITAQNAYRHYNGTYIYWYQIVDNIQREEDFEFSMNYLYENGPIGTNYIDIFEFGFDVLNGTSVLWNWSIDATNITQRSTWYSTGSVPVNIPQAPTQFEVRISLKVSTLTEFIQIPEDDGDLDGEPGNGRYLTLHVDDVSFTSLHSPSLQDVDFNVNISPLGTFPILSPSEQGTILLNHSYWERASIPFTFSSNTSVSFEFQAKINKMTRFYNSTYSMNLENEGVAYSIPLGTSAEFSLHTYIPSYPEASGIGFTVHHPSDWYNPRVENPFGQDITNQVVIEIDHLIIPSGFADSAGWWKITYNGHNYVETVVTQVRDDYDITWIDESGFDSGDRVRCRALIGTELNTVEGLSDVEIVWYLPSGDVWSTEITDNLNGSLVLSRSTTLGPINATIGEWLVSVSWTNGSEVGYGYALFELYHHFTLFAHSPNIEIESGDEFTVAIYLYDQDNGNVILSEADVKGNLSSETVHFDPNFAKGWWEADFNSTLLGAGNHVMIIEVSMPFFVASSTSVSIEVESLFIITLRAGLVGALLVGISVVTVFVSRRFYMAMVAKRNVELMSLEGRIDDAKNLIGLLVIHRAIGLPVYSKILKGGFQEALLSSFISAISQFRSEFSMDEPTWTAIPITEAILAVQTQALICAIITVEAASYRQKTQLEAFGREVGGLYDHEDDTMRRIVRTPSLNGIFDPIYESHFDGQLMKRYVGVTKSLPKHLSLISDALETMEIDHGVSVEALIKAISVLGYSERHSYKTVLDAVDNGYLIPADTKLPSPISEEEEEE